MKRLLTILFICSFAVTCFAQRVTDIITSINSNTSEAVTINTAWTGTDGDLVLSASVPASVKVGDTITDNGANTYLITGISGSNLTSQDFDTTTDPVTGAATIQEAYATITLWEADLDVTALYAASDDAQGEMYNNGAFDEAVTMNGGGTVSLTSVTLTVPTAERHDGTAGTGARIVASVTRVFFLNTPSGFTLNYTIEWFEIDQGGNEGPSIDAESQSATQVGIIRNMIVHDQATGDARLGLVRASGRDVLVMNSIFYDNTRNALTRGLNLDGDQPGGGCINNTVFNISTSSATADAYGIRIESDDTDGRVRNNIVMQTTISGGGSGAALDFSFAGSANLTSSNNMSEDDTADDGGGANHVISVSVANQFVSTTGGSEDLHIQDNAADSFEAGVDLGTTPTGVNIDIDNFDRNAGATTWSIGAHDGDNLRGAAAVRRRNIIIIP